MLQIDEQRSLRSLDGNRDLLIQLAQIFTEDAPILIENLLTALDQNDAASARRAAHSLKGLVSTFFASQTSESAHQVEVLCAAGDLDSVRHRALAKLIEGVHQLIDEMKRRQWSY